MKRKNRISRHRSLMLIPVTLAMIWCMIPLYVMVVGALKPSVALSVLPADLNPFRNIRWDNFVKVLRTSDMGKAFLNSLIISVGTCVLTVFVGITGGYAFAKLKFRGRGLLFIVLLVTMMLPSQVMMIPRYMVAKNLNLTNRLYGVILTTVNGAYGIFLCRQFIVTIPDVLLDAACLDGCSEFGRFIHIVVPVSGPVIASLTVFTFIASWNDFVWQNILLSGKALRTIPLALAFLNNNPDTNSLALQFAGATLSSVPMIVLFLFFQKYFVKGITGGAVKE